MLASQFGDPDAPGVVPSAVVVELTHLATLYHDDVMDEADVRRGVPSANTRWGNSVAVLTGDFLFARASHILADLGPEAVRIQAEAFERLVTGQILETAGPRDGRDPVDHYLDVLSGKTGSLVAVSGRFGALMSGADERTVDVLTQYGERLGIAFQLADDVLDIASDSHESGKTPGTDLREGIPTLPVLRLRAQAAADGKPDDLELVELLDGDLSSDDALAEVLRGCAPTRRWSGPARTPCATPRRRAPRSPLCPRGTRRPRWRSCATRWCTAPVRPCPAASGPAPPAVA
ncbi:hypothetical protein SBADM41S_07219 [Streptomyces badius]